MFIVGGGPSLQGFDFSRLRGARIIAVNRAFEYLPFADILFSMDNRYYGEIRMTKEFRGFRGRKVWINTMNFHYEGVETLKIYDVPGMSPSVASGISTGGNSGYAALNLALLLGADPVYLLGFDFKAANGRSHFHPGYRFVSHPEKLDAWRARLEAVAPSILATGRRVINLSTNSALTGFPFARFEDVPRNPDFRVVSYFTDENYQRLAERLIASLDHFGIPHDVRNVPSRGSWTENTGYRAEFIKGIMTDHPGENVVWIDADGVIQRYPILLHELGDADFAAHYRAHPNGRRELLGGTVFHAGKESILAMMDEWIAESKTIAFYKDQRALQNVIERDPRRFHVYRLPATYCQIFDLMKNEGVPVIEHFQASRKLKRVVR